MTPLALRGMALAALLLPTPAPGGDSIRDLGPLTLAGAAPELRDISGVELCMDHLWLTDDEHSMVLPFRPRADDPLRFEYHGEAVPLGSREIDLEGLACDGERLHAIGSHSWVRSKGKKGTVRRRIEREQWVTIEKSSTGDPFEVVARRSLRSELDHPTLRPFSDVPGKENGINVEALAADGHHLWLGLRSPRLQTGRVPLLESALPPGDRRPSSMTLLDLDGLGLRGLERVGRGFLLLAGPADRWDPRNARLFFWSGKGDAVELGELPALPGGAAEGVALIEETKHEWEIVIVYDGPLLGAPRRFRVTK